MSNKRFRGKLNESKRAFYMSSLRALALATGLLCLATTGVLAQAFSAVSDPDRVVQGFGFTVLPPSGNNWYFTSDPGSAAVAFAKKDPDHARQRGSVILTVALVRAGSDDITTPEGLRAEVEKKMRANSARFKLVSLTVEPRLDADEATDCVRISTTSEERDNPNRPGETLLLALKGKACRHPLAPTYFVYAALSERRPAQGNPLVDDKLKAETDRAMNSLAFVPVR